MNMLIRRASNLVGGHMVELTDTLVYTRELGLLTMAMTGASDGQLRCLVDVPVDVPSEETAQIQECRILAGHALCDAVESAIVARL